MNQKSAIEFLIQRNPRHDRFYQSSHSQDLRQWGG